MTRTEMVNKAAELADCGLVSIPMLRRALDWGRDEFDAALTECLNNDEFAGIYPADGSLMSAEDIEDCVIIGGSRFSDLLVA